MTRHLLLLCLALAGAQTAWAADEDAPLAVTTLARTSGGGAPTPRQQEQSDAFLRQGEALLKSGQPLAAVQACNDSVRLAPGADNYKALGTAYAQAGNDRKAAWAYRESLRLKQDPTVQALVDALGQGPDDSPSAGYARCLAAAAQDRAAGRALPAVQGYRDAYALRPGLESAGPGLQTAAQGAAAAWDQGDAVLALQVLAAADAMRACPGLDAASGADADRVAALESRAEKATGVRMQDHIKAMHADPDGWARSVRAKMSATGR